MKSLRVANLEDLTLRAKRLAEAVFDEESLTPEFEEQARDLLSRIAAHEAIHGSTE